MLRFGKLTRFLSSSPSSSVAAAASESCRSSWDPTASLRLDHPALIILEKCETREQFKQILAHMTRSHLIFQTFPLSRLLQFSAASHPENLDLAIVLFEHFAHHPNLYIYNTMLRALSFSATQSTAYYRSMLSCRIIPNQHTFLAMLKSSRSFSEGKQIHAHAVVMGLSSDTYLQNSLIKMYSENGKMGLARELFRHLNRKDIASCNILITALARNGRNLEALEIIHGLPLSDFEPDQYTAVGLLLCCSQLRDWSRGKSIHSWMIRRTPVEEWGLVLCNSLLDLYARSGKMDTALKIFEGLKEKDAVSWNIMIARSAGYGDFDLALRLFDQMPHRELVSWNSLLSGYAQNGCWNSAVKLFEEMLLHDVSPDKVSMVALLCASSELGLLHQGRLLHGWVLKNNMKLDPFLGSALVDMYCKCGSLQRAITTFRSIPKRDVAVWTAMMSGLAFHGCGVDALLLFQEMQADGAAPNELTFIAILTACAHAGLVDTGCIIFDSIKKNHGIDPTVEHYGCLVDLLARAGRLTEVQGVIEAMPMRPSRSIWGAFLAASRAHGDLDMARLASEELLKLEPEEEGGYVLLSSAYASGGRWSCSGCIREMMNSRGVKKAAGCSRVFIDGVAHRFVASDYTHPMWEMIYCVLSSLNKEMRSDVAGLWRTSYGCMCS
ncbi:unnamed protein product [Spirodela intermedia]|uniref:Uncharacterized protein n=1 Tax=Spirodela intermedia TaxID=51605 RepID=A0A7I8JXM4_SPIIN|nr:unnamed protein product [Spirodela intermedia]